MCLCASPVCHELTGYICSFAAFAPSTTVVHRSVVPSTCAPRLTALRAEVRKDADGRLRKSTADEDTDLNGFANPMAKGAYVEDGWVDETAGPGLFENLFGGMFRSKASDLAKRDALAKQLDQIEFLDGSKGSLLSASRGGTAVPFGGLNPAQVQAYDLEGKQTEEKKPWGGYAPMPESAIEFFIKYPNAKPGADQNGQPLPAGWYSAEDETSGQEYYYKDDGTTTWERPQA